MKSSDFTNDVSLSEQLDEITPSAHGKITAKARDELRKKHGLPTTRRRHDPEPTHKG
jgi:hypothetical protein